MLNSWYSGTGIKIEYAEMIEQIKNHVRKNEKLFIGTDSQLSSSSCII